MADVLIHLSGPFMLRGKVSTFRYLPHPHCKEDEDRETYHDPTNEVDQPFFLRGVIITLRTC
jgi:hypothetical protein